MRAAEREGFVPQVKNFVRQAEKERGRGRKRARTWARIATSIWSDKLCARKTVEFTDYGFVCHNATCRRSSLRHAT